MASILQTAFWISLFISNKKDNKILLNSKIRTVQNWYEKKNKSHNGLNFLVYPYIFNFAFYLFLIYWNCLPQELHRPFCQVSSGFEILVVLVMNA